TATFSLIGDPIPGLTLNPDGSWSFDPDDAAYDSLADGEQLTITVPYQVSDGIGATATSSFLIKLNGTNLAPTLDAPLAAPTLREGDGAFALNLLTGARDPDTGSLASLLSISDITYSIDGANPSSEVPDGLVLNGAVLVVDPSHSAFEHLAEGDTLTVVVSYSIADAQGATVAQTATVTITGSNNAPTITLAADQAATEAGAAISGQLTASDPDNADTATFSLIGDPIPGLTLNPDGSWSFDPADPAYDDLADGQILPIPVRYSVTDNNTASAESVFSILLTGTNDAPSVTLVNADSASASLSDGASALVATGTLTAVDPDRTDVLTTSVTSVAISGIDIAALPSDLTADDNAALKAFLSLLTTTFAADPDSSSNLAWSFDSSPEAFDFLADGQTLTLTYAVDVTDSSPAAATAQQLITIAITGTNDAPVATSIAEPAVNEDASPFSINLLTTASDPDATDSLSVLNLSLSAVDSDGLTVTLPNGAINLDGNTLNVEPSAFNALATDETVQITIQYTVSDGISTINNTATLTITGTNDSPIVSLIEDDSTSTTLIET
ncbi:MAG: hypothetical protein EBZ24_12290, partial [Synechococcaceae bacterium WB9_4xB_025]|nr:hypothetical protein [Synechococcaceae bacterium WB9_4xB_025]